jgi:hypothetical protein
VEIQSWRNVLALRLDETQINDRVRGWLKLFRTSIASEDFILQENRMSGENSVIIKRGQQSLGEDFVKIPAAA